MALEPIKKNQTLKQQAYEQIRQAINTNSMKPGTPLTEEQLSHDLSISRTPIRSAIQQLVHEKLLTQDATGHIFVSTITEKDVADISNVRVVLETMAIDFVTFPLAETYLNKLDEIYQKQLTFFQTQSTDNLGYAELDCAFHCALASCCDNTFLLEFIKEINQIMIRINVLSGTLDANKEIALNEHKDIISYLKNGQKEFAKVALNEHLKHVEQRMLVSKK
jgi:DNA-binding GntR family transcriptional regulator